MYGKKLLDLFINKSKQLGYHVTKKQNGFGLCIDVYDNKRQIGIDLKLSEIELQDSFLLTRIIINIIKEYS